MNYRPDILSAYDAFFKEAHVALFSKEQRDHTKQAGIRDRISKYLVSKMRHGKVLAEDLAKEQAATQRLNKILQLKDLDLAAAKGDLSAATRALEQHQGKAFDPAAFAKSEQRQKITHGLGAGALGLGAIGVPAAYYGGKAQGEADKTQTRNLAFDTGAAAGLAAPYVIKGLGRIAQGLDTQGLLPSYQNYQGGS